MTPPMRLDPASPFGVVIPLHDGERTIGRALASIAAQTVAPREVVVVDDGSSDGGPGIAAAVAGVTVLRQRRSGPGPARNAGAACVTAPWVAFLDADDVWLPGHLETLSRLITDAPDAGLVASGHRQVRVVPTAGRTARRHRPARPLRIDYHRRAGRDIGVVWTSAAAVRTEVLRTCGGFPAERAGEDLDLWARLALDHPVVITRRVTALYVRGTGGIMESIGATSRPAGPRSLHDVSPSVRSMLAALESGGHAAPSRSIERYVDGRITSGWRGVLLRAGQPEARRLLRLLHHPWHPTAWRYRAAAWLPRPVGRLVAATVRMVSGLRARRR